MSEKKEPRRLGDLPGMRQPDTLYTSSDTMRQIIGDSGDNRPYDERFGEHICPTCRGFGWINNGIIDTTDPGYGKSIPCPEPGCPVTRSIKQERSRKLYERSGLPAKYKDFTFESWQRLNVSEGKMLATAACKLLAKRKGEGFFVSECAQEAGVNHRVVDDVITFRTGQGDYEMMNTHHNSIVLSGFYGMGKTGLAVATANALIDAGLYVVSINMPAWIERVKSTYSGSGRDVMYGQTLDEMAKPLAEADILVIDEFNSSDSESATATEHDQRLVMAYIYGPRWSGGNTKPVIITTNKDQRTFAHYWRGQISTRVFELCVWTTMRGDAPRRFTGEVPAI